MSISYDKYLMAKGLFHLATEHRRKSSEFEHALHDLLNVDIHSHISDAIWDDNDTLEDALKREGVEVEEPPTSVKEGSK